MRRRILITMATGIQWELQMPDLVAFAVTAHREAISYPAGLWRSRT